MLTLWPYRYYILFHLIVCLTEVIEGNINHLSFTPHPLISLLLQIKDGQVCLAYDLGHGNTSGCVPFSINDGNWHTVGQRFT